MIAASDFHAAVRPLWRLYLIALHVVLAMIVGNEDLAQIISRDTAHPNIRVREFYYSDGLFYQLVEPDEADELPASWNAAIRRNGFVMCNGGSTWVYTPKTLPVSMTPSYWTGDECDLIVGDTYVAEANWTWANPEGLPESVSRSIEFVHTATKNGQP